MRAFSLHLSSLEGKTYVMLQFANLAAFCTEAVSDEMLGRWLGGSLSNNDGFIDFLEGEKLWLFAEDNGTWTSLAGNWFVNDEKFNLHKEIDAEKIFTDEQLLKLLWCLLAFARMVFPAWKEQGELCELDEMAPQIHQMQILMNGIES